MRPAVAILFLRVSCCVLRRAAVRAQDAPPILSPTPTPAMDLPTRGGQRHARCRRRKPSSAAASPSSPPSDIQRKQQRTLPEVLQDVPGLYLVSRPAAPAVPPRCSCAAPTPITPRCLSTASRPATRARRTAHSISRRSSPPTSSASKCCAARRAASTASDAVGGVINIVTKTGSGPPQVRAMVEGGSFDTFNQTAGVSGSVVALQL